MLREDFFDSNGVRLHFLDWGGGGRDLVLLGGLGATAHLFRGLAPRLAERFRVTAFTRRVRRCRSDRVPRCRLSHGAPRGLVVEVEVDEPEHLGLLGSAGREGGVVSSATVRSLVAHRRHERVTALWAIACSYSSLRA
jgi:pimeloyl-ACP methyl ester carboxylesterase